MCGALPSFCWNTVAHAALRSLHLLPRKADTLCAWVQHLIEKLAQVTPCT